MPTVSFLQLTFQLIVMALASAYAHDARADTDLLNTRQQGSFVRYSGCFGTINWQSSPTSFNLTVAFSRRPDNGIIPCSAACSTSRHFILWDQECFCAPSITINTTTGYIPQLSEWEATEGDCWRLCRDEPGVTCGGSARAAFYEHTDPPTVQNPGIEPVQGFHWWGCFADFTPDRVLRRFAGASNDMTPTKCAGMCGAEARWVGVEYGRECFCGATIDNSYKTFGRRCGRVCEGDGRWFCGGGGHLTVYERDGARGDGDPVGGYDYLGCYRDRVNGTRTLANGPNSAADMTLEKCAERAESGNWKYFGVEFGRECWTGNSLSSEIITDRCNQPCAGNGGQACGASDKLNLYIQRNRPSRVCSAASTPDVDSLACGIRGFPVPAGSRPVTSTETTAARCAAACASATGCSSSVWDKLSGVCRLYDTGVWASIGDNVSTAGSDFKHVIAHDAGCWVCQDTS
ncbi:hypothetical protein QC763_401844 [Podospora pseudopauciseta]|uniref:WSC domain-containing protein n=1 Tax=Podospora pseudopauciseta TaxID=2093780 RepID=A0ABR0HBK6_9PEZI|nr:hypothetical protein QC763_401844 [Podospora pseudopauciseta]